MVYTSKYNTAYLTFPQAFDYTKDNYIHCFSMNSQASQIESVEQIGHGFLPNKNDIWKIGPEFASSHVL